MNDPNAPQGIRLLLSDGKTVDCDAVRAPELDKKTPKGVITYYKAVPREPLAPDISYRATVDRMPPKTGLFIDVEPVDLMSAMEKPDQR